MNIDLLALVELDTVIAGFLKQFQESFQRKGQWSNSEIFVFIAFFHSYFINTII